jgi:hypothetical protein
MKTQKQNDPRHDDLLQKHTYSPANTNKQAANSFLVINKTEINNKNRMSFVEICSNGICSNKKYVLIYT